MCQLIQVKRRCLLVLFTFQNMLDIARINGRNMTWNTQCGHGPDQEIFNINAEIFSVSYRYSQGSFIQGGESLQQELVDSVLPLEQDGQIANQGPTRLRLYIFSMLIKHSAVVVDQSQGSNAD